MAEHRATRELTLFGRTYHRGEVVPMEKVEKQRPDLAKKLVDQHRVAPDAVHIGRKGS